MDETTARKLSRLTGLFYEQVSLSFSQTRQAPWPGWDTVLDIALPASWQARRKPYHLLDLACGNLRFERYCAERMQGQLPDATSDAVEPLVIAHALDDCDALVEEGSVEGGLVQVRYRHLDIAEELFAGHDPASRLEAGPCDLSVCFGFMHHLALPEHRVRVLEALVRATRPGGYVALSLWQLSNSVRLLSKARATTARACAQLGIEALGQGDYLLGWQGRSDVWRYCHDFSEDEVADLLLAVGDRACEVARFSADGATGNLNRYLVLQAR